MVEFNWTAEQEMAIQEFLTKAISQNHKCAHCIYNHDDICFFACECFLNDFNKYDEGDD